MNEFLWKDKGHKTRKGATGEDLSDIYKDYSLPSGMSPIASLLNADLSLHNTETQKQLRDQNISFAEPIEQNLPAKEEMRDFDSVIVNFMKEQGIPGASLCVAKGGHIIYTQSKAFVFFEK